jgi:uncharacterized protein (DUF342 family)
MAIGRNKKRYYITLTPDNVDRFKALCNRLQLPENTMSSALDDMLVSLSETFETAINAGQKGMKTLIDEADDKLSQMKEEYRVCEKRKKKATP